jgi:NAD(P)-dependent dehydrogenase (short-subunit alcohol dehydrogenase family)
MDFIKMTAKIRNKNIIVSGATGTIGSAIVKSLAKNNNIISISRKNPSLYNVEWIECDLSYPEKIQNIFYNSIYKNNYHIDAIINVAGIQGEIGNFWDISYPSFYDCININLMSPIEIIKSSLPLMRNGGKIINFSGGGATSNRTFFSPYAISKIGLVKFTEIAGEELKLKGIDINCVAPGKIYSKMTEEVINSDIASLENEEYISAIDTRDNRTNNLQNIVGLVNFLLSKESDGITGNLISAVWDKWQDKNWIKNKLEENVDSFKLRRIK